MQPPTPVADRALPRSRHIEPALPVGSSPVLEPAGPAAAQVTVFLCANSARGGVVPPAGVRLRPSLPPVQWPFSAKEIVLPCAGKIQPEHILKAFEAGADLVCVIACDGDNCHYLEGSHRAENRVEYVRLLLDELGLGRERLLLFHLPGSAREDMALGCAGVGQSSGLPPCNPGGLQDNTEDLARRLKSIAEEIAGKLKELGVTPLKEKRGERKEK